MTAPGPGLFVTLEGIDGVGKSTQCARLAQRLRDTGRDVVVTREPGGSPGAEQIRALLLTGAAGRWSAVSEALLFTAARRDHVERVIEPALASGTVVICDRFVDSTRAYQGAAGRGMVDALHRLAIGRDPDLTLILDADPGAAGARRQGRDGAEDRFEQRGAAFQTGLRAAFLAIAVAEPGRCQVIDASGDVDTVADRVWAAVAARGA